MIILETFVNFDNCKCFSAIKIRLKPTKEQENKFWQCCGIRRFAYNWGIFTIESDYENGKKSVDCGELLRRLTKEKKENPDFAFLKDQSCDIAKQAIKDLCDAYSRFFDMQKEENYQKFTKKTIENAERVGKDLTRIDMNGHPKPKCKKNHKKDSFYLDWFQIEIGDGFVHIPRIGKVRTRNSHRGLQTFPLKDRGNLPKMINCTVSFDGKYWILSSSFEFYPEENDEPRTEPIGVDLGIKDAAICSDGTVFSNINKSKKVRLLKKKKKRLQRKLSRKLRMNKESKMSKNAEKLKNKIHRIDRKLTNIRENYRHQLTNEIVKRNPSFIVLENLNIKVMMKNRHLSEKIQEQGWFYILTYFQQKCKRKFIELLKVDTFYPSSKTCQKCGNIHKNLKLSDRTFVCPVCNFAQDRDLNAAINLKNYGLKLLQTQ